MWPLSYPIQAVAAWSLSDSYEYLNPVRSSPTSFSPASTSQIPHAWFRETAQSQASAIAAFQLADYMDGQ